MNNVLKNFAILVVLTTGCSSRQQSKINIEPIPVSVPVVATALTFNSSNIPNFSGQWTFVTTDATNGSEISIDINTTTRQGNIVRFWQRRILRTPDQFGSSVYLNYQSTDCANAVWQLHKDIYLDSFGRITNQMVADGPVQNIIPGSVGGEIYRIACSNQPNAALQPQAAQAQITQAQLEALTRRSQVNAEVSADLMRSAASLAK